MHCRLTRLLSTFSELYPKHPNLSSTGTTFKVPLPPSRRANSSRTYAQTYCRFPNLKLPLFPSANTTLTTSFPSTMILKPGGGSPHWVPTNLSVSTHSAHASTTVSSASKDSRPTETRREKSESSDLRPMQPV